MGYWWVRNISGTSKRPRCDCRTWIDHWYEETGSSRTTCAALGCSEPATVGAHVIDVTRSNTPRQHWIIPTCHGCNMNRDDYQIKNVELISANTQITGCYRPFVRAS